MPATRADSPYTPTRATAPFLGGSGGRLGRLPQGAEALEEACCGGGPLLYYEGGTVQDRPTVHLILWGANFNPGGTGENAQNGAKVRNMLEELFRGLEKNSAYQGILTQYFGATSRVAPEMNFPAPYVYTETAGEAAPQSVERAKVEHAIKQAIEANGWSVEPNAQFVVATAPGSTYQEGFIKGDCAYHSVASDGAIYDFDPYQGDPKFVNTGCLSEDTERTPVNMTSHVASHEYSEAATDPKVNCETGWRTRDCGEEIGDLCTFNGDKELKLPGDHAWVQGEYDDHLGGCAYEDLNPPHILGLTNQATNVGVSSATLNATVNDEGEPREATYYFEYATNSSFTGATRVPTKAISAGVGFANHAVHQTVTGLAVNSLYYYRVVAQNGTKTTTGETQEFRPSEWRTAPSAATAGLSSISCVSSRFCMAPLGPFYATNTETWDGIKWSFQSLPVLEGGTEVKRPEGVAVDSKGDVWVVDGANYRVAEYSAEGTFMRTFGWGVQNGEQKQKNELQTCTANCRAGLPGSGPGQIGEEGQYKQAVGIAVAPNGNLWVADPGNARVSEFNPETSQVKFETEIGPNGPDHFGLVDPLGVAVDPKTENVWVADFTASQVDEFSSNGTAITHASASEPDGVAVDASGENVWTSEVNLQRVSDFKTSEGKLVKTVGWGVGGGTGFEICPSNCSPGIPGPEPGQFHQPTGIGIDSGGNVWIAEEWNDRVQELSAAGNHVTQFGSLGASNGQLSRPWGVVAASGSLYVADTDNNRVERWTIGAEGSQPTYASKFGGAASPARLVGVSCTSTTACTAVGNFVSGSEAVEPLAERWNGSEWSSEVVPLPKGATAAVLLGVSCSTSSECMAVGYSETGGGSWVPYTAQRTSAGWNEITIEAPTGRYTELRSVSCTSATACVAVGQTGARIYEFGGHTTFAASWNGTQWTKLPTVSPPGSSETVFDGVSCGSATSCEVVGSYSSISLSLLALAANWNGKEWSVQTAAPPSKLRDYFAGVSCSSASTCMAVGNYERKPNVWVPLVESWNGETLRVQPTSTEVDNEVGAYVEELFGVSCVNSLDCIAVGNANRGEQQIALTSVIPSYVSSFGSSGSGAGQIKQPEGIAVDSKDDFWVVDAANYRVDEFSAEGTFMRTFGWGVLTGKNALQTCIENCRAGLPGSGLGQIGKEGAYTQAVGIAVAPNGNLWVADPGNARVSEFKPEASQVKFVTEIGPNGPDHFGLKDPLGVAVDPKTESVWVADWAGQLDKFSSTGTAITQVPASNTDGVGVDPVTGNVWTSELNLNRVSEFTSEGALVRTVGWGVQGGTGFEICPSSCSAGKAGPEPGQFNSPTGIGIDASGNVWIADRNNNRVQELSASGNYVTQFGSLGAGAGQLSAPWGVVAVSGSLSVTDTNNNRVEKLGVVE
jgi:DNA-binding beta-propeller fold protein YncE